MKSTSWGRHGVRDLVQDLRQLMLPSFLCKHQFAPGIMPCSGASFTILAMLILPLVRHLLDVATVLLRQVISLLTIMFITLFTSLVMRPLPPSCPIISGHRENSSRAKGRSWVEFTAPPTPYQKPPRMPGPLSCPGPPAC
jgi:hypothetical protein